MVVKQFCTQCGSETDREMVFCSACGTQVISSESPSDAGGTEQESSAPSMNEKNPSHSFIQGIAGHASSSSVQDAINTYGDMLVANEQVLAAYKWVRDEVVFTSLRIIYQDVQGITGKKKSFLSIPYSSIHKFSKESAGWMDWDAELRIWVRGESEPIKWEFKKDEAVNDIFSIISEKVLT